MRRTTRAAGGCVLAAMLNCPHVQSAGAPPLAGRSLEHAIAVLEQQGLRVFYSSDLVRPWMQVTAEPPAAAGPVDALEVILAAHGLKTRPGPKDSLLVVRDPERRAAAVPPPAEAGARAGTPLLEAPAAPLEEILVAGSRYELRRPVSASRIHFGSRALEYLPNLGEDAIRAVGRLPGTASSDFSARSSLRGGALDETLVRLDGLRLYDPFHLKDFQGVFSMVDPRIVRSMDIYTGGFPAAFGDRMSGVIDIETIVPPAPLYHEIGFSFFNLSLLSAGQFAGGRGEWVGSLRRSNLDLLYQEFSERPDRPRYVDAFGKISYDLNDSLRITAELLRSEDDITLADDLDREEYAEARHSDRYAWIKLEHSPNESILGTTTLAQAALDSERRGTTAKGGISAGTLSDMRAFTIATLESDWSLSIGDALLLQAGGSVQSVEGRYHYTDEAEFDVLFDIEGAPTETARTRSIRLAPRGREYGLYANLRYRFTPRTAGELGLRWHRQTLDAGNTATLGPRLGLRYRLSERIDLRASWGRFHQSQSINELAVGDGESTFHPPEHAEHLVVGLDRRFDRGLRLRIDLYQKELGALRPRYENLLNSQILLPELKPDRIRITPDAARAHGVELMVDSAPGPVQWWLGYSYARVRDRIGGRWVPRSWDQTHALTAGVTWDAPRWNVSAAWLYRSGWPTTPVTLDASGRVPVAMAPSGRNAERLGAYRTLDLRITRKIDLPRSSLRISFELMNAFGRGNPCCVEYEIELGDLEIDLLRYPSAIPSIGVLWKF